MTTARAHLDSVIAQSIKNISAAAQAVVRETVVASLGSAPAAKLDAAPRRRPGPKPKAAKRSAKVAAPKPKRTPAAKRERTSAETMAAREEQAIAYAKTCGGTFAVGDLAKELSLDARDAGLIVKKLKARRILIQEGDRRFARYRHGAPGRVVERDEEPAEAEA